MFPHNLDFGSQNPWNECQNSYPNPIKISPETQSENLLKIYLKSPQHRPQKWPKIHQNGSKEPPGGPKSTPRAPKSSQDPPETPPGPTFGSFRTDFPLIWKPNYENLLSQLTRIITKIERTNAPLHQRSKITTTEPNSNNHDSPHLGPTHLAGGTPEGITITITYQ